MEGCMECVYRQQRPQYYECRFDISQFGSWCTLRVCLSTCPRLAIQTRYPVLLFIINKRCRKTWALSSRSPIPHVISDSLALPHLPLLVRIHIEWQRQLLVPPRRRWCPRFL
jgi:hypothetical protein